MDFDADLLTAIKAKLPDLEKLHDDVAGHWTYEDGIYRLYHQSFKVCFLQGVTLQIVEALRALAPDRPLNAWFLEIIEQGTKGAKPRAGAGQGLLGLGEQDGRPIIGGAVLTFDMAWNQDWLRHTRPIVEAFLHAKFMLEMAVKYGKTIDDPERMLPSGWAALLSLYNAR